MTTKRGSHEVGTGRFFCLKCVVVDPCYMCAHENRDSLRHSFEQAEARVVSHRCFDAEYAACRRCGQFVCDDDLYEHMGHDKRGRTYCMGCFLEEDSHRGFFSDEEEEEEAAGWSSASDCERAETVRELKWEMLPNP